MANATHRSIFTWARLRPFFNVSNMGFWAASFIFVPIPWLSLLKNIFKLRLTGLPASLVDHYQKLREAAIQPIVDFLHQFHIPLPPWLIDCVVIYVLVAAIVARAGMINRPIDQKKWADDPAAVEKDLRAAAAELKLDPEELISRFKATISPGFVGWQ